MLFPCPETLCVTHASPSPHSFFSSHIFLKEEPNPALVETGCYYLQEKQKILILSETQRKQWVRRMEAETSLQHCHYKYQRSESLVPFLQAGKHRGEAGTLSQEGGRQSSPPTAGTAGSTACATQAYLKQRFQDTEIRSEGITASLT